MDHFNHCNYVETAFAVTVSAPAQASLKSETDLDRCVPHLCAPCRTAVLEWGFRYYPLGEYCWREHCRGGQTDQTGEGKGAPKTSRIVWNAIGMAAAFLSWLFRPSFSRNTHHRNHRRLSVTRAVYTLTDTAGWRPTRGWRVSKAQREFWYPAHADESFPLVIFPTGVWHALEQRVALQRTRQPRYVVAAIDHTYQNLRHR